MTPSWDGPLPGHGPTWKSGGPHRGVDETIERWFLTGVLFAAAVVSVVLVVGHLSAGLVSRALPRFELRAAPGVVWKAVTTPSDPGSGWDAVNTGGEVPGPLAWWATVAVLVALAGLVGLSVRAVRRRRRGDTVAWAQRRELRKLVVRRPAPGRLVVGRFRRRLVATEARHSVLVLGPTQSGKTTGLAIPAILEWHGPVLATSTKGDLVDDTIAWRSRLGRVSVYDPAGVTDHAPACWSPLAGCERWGTSQRRAWELAQAAKAAVGTGVHLADLWFSGAAKALAPYLHAAALTRRGMDDVARWVDDEEFDVPAAALVESAPDAVLALRATFAREARARSGLFQCMQQAVGAYLDPAIAHSSRRHDVDASRLLSGGRDTVYVTAPHLEQARLRPLFSTIVGQVVAAAYTRSAETGRPLDPPLLLVLDEAANIAPVDDLAGVVSTAAAHGIQVVTVFQDLAQVKTRYGQSAGTVVNNHRAKLVLPGAADLDTLEAVSRLVGDQEVDRPSVTTDAVGRRSRTTATHWRRMLAPELVRQLPEGHAVLLYGRLPPARLKLRPWYDSRRLRRQATLPLTMVREPSSVGTGEYDEPRLASGSIDRAGRTVTILDRARATRNRSYNGKGGSATSARGPQAVEA